MVFVEEHRTWRLRLGSVIVNGVVFALIGEALSLTQGTHAQRWPWALACATFGVGLVLICYDRIANRLKRPVQQPSDNTLGSVVFHNDGRVEMTPGAQTLGASVGPVGPAQKVFYAEAIANPQVEIVEHSVLEQP